jgi:bifunctional DNA-binding transcriptional regulator/antitoxin component of YhaV-PrlF toxin-antitoxin module
MIFCRSMRNDQNVTVVTERGQVSIPAPLRRGLDLVPGRRLRWERGAPGELRVVVLPDAPPRGAEAMRGFARRFRETRRTEDWMRELREGES